MIKVNYFTDEYGDIKAPITEVTEENSKEFATESEAKAFVNKCTLAYIEPKKVPIPQELKETI